MTLHVTGAIFAKAGWKLIPGASGLLTLRYFVAVPQLLDEQWRPSVNGLVPNSYHPGQIQRSRIFPARPRIQPPSRHPEIEPNQSAPAWVRLRHRVALESVAGAAAGHWPFADLRWISRTLVGE